MEFCCQRCGVSLAFSLDEPAGDAEPRRSPRRRSRGRPRPAGEDEALPALQPLLPRPPSGAGDSAPPPPPLGPRRRPSHVGASVSGNASLLDGSFLVLDAALRGASSRVEGGEGRWDPRPGDGWGRRDGDAAGSGARASKWGAEWNAGGDDEESDEEDDEAEGAGGGGEARHADGAGAAASRSAAFPGGTDPRSGAGTCAAVCEPLPGAESAPEGAADGCGVAEAGEPAAHPVRAGATPPSASDVAGGPSRRRPRPGVAPTTQPGTAPAPAPLRAGAALSSPPRPPAPSRRGPGALAAASPLPASAPVRIEALVSAMDAASGATGVDHPLCGRCARCVRERLRERIRVAREETKAYERALRELGIEVSDDDASDPEGGAGVGTDSGREAGPGAKARGVPPPPGETAAGDVGVPPPTGAEPSSSAAATSSALPPASPSPPRRSPSPPSSPPGSSPASSASSPPDSPRSPGASSTALEEAQRSLAAARRSLSRVSEERRALRRASESLGALERRYLLDLNAYELSLEAHLEDRESLSRGIARAAATLAALRKTDVFSDALRIWFDGPFGTIAGLRLGRTSSAPVSWAEINAAWGAAVLLLAALRRECHAPPDPNGTRLLPMGSCPRVADARGTCELYGPVAKLFCPGYDRAQVAFLSSLAHFAAWLDHERGRRRGARAGGGKDRPGGGAGRDDAGAPREGSQDRVLGPRDEAHLASRGYQDPAQPQRGGRAGETDAGLARLAQRGAPEGDAAGQRAPAPGQPGASSAQPRASAAPVHFALPWPIEGDRVGSYSIRYGLAKDKTWTRALKCMLVDLKVCVKVAREHLDQVREQER